jgi:hypothetical protein
MITQQVRVAVTPKTFARWGGGTVLISAQALATGVGVFLVYFGAFKRMHGRVSVRRHAVLPKCFSIN